MKNENEPTLTCSEVVERLHNECVLPEFGKQFDRDKATEIINGWRERVRKEQLDEIRSDPASTVCGIPMPDIMKLICERKENGSEWRERRVQELEEALLKLLGPHEWEKDLSAAKELAEKLLTNSEQIRKGAKHE